MRFYNIFVLFLILVVMTACPLDKKEETGMIYSHVEHAQEIRDRTAWRDCEACHQIGENRVHFSLPSHRGKTGCYGTGKCHDGAEPLDGIKAHEDCLECHTRKDGQLTQVVLRFQDVIFSHETHTKAPDGTEYKCEDCHDTIDKNKYTPLSKTINTHSMAMETCIECHRDTDTSNRCETCHRDTYPELKPEYHTASWPVTHGKIMKRFGSAIVCERCHQPLSNPGGNSCDECHTQTKPASHTMRWNKSLHGRAAVRDRRACATCHQANFCSDCHTERPASHFAPMFEFDGSGHTDLARKKLRSCYTCHSFETDCAECHSR